MRVLLLGPRPCYTKPEVVTVSGSWSLTSHDASFSFLFCCELDVAFVIKRFILEQCSL